MMRGTTSSANAVALWTLAVVAILFFLRAAKTLLIPMALAVLVSYALAPIVTWLERRRVARQAGAALVLLLIICMAGGGAYALKDDARTLVEALPRTLERGRAMVRAQLGVGGKVIEEAVKGTESSGRESGAGEQTADPMTEVTVPLIQQGVGGVLSLAGHVVVITFLIYFLLISVITSGIA